MSRRRYVRPSSSAVPRHRRSFDPTRLIKAGTIGAAVIALAALLGLGGTAALWQDTATINPGSLSSGSIGIQQDGFTTIGGEIASDGVRSTKLTVTNPGRSTATISSTVAFTADSDAGLVKDVRVHLWAMAPGTNCETTATPAGAGSPWAAIQGLPAAVQAGQSIDYCVRTVLSNPAAYAGKSYSATLTIVASNGSWRSSARADFTQKVAPAVAATGSCNQAWEAEIRWDEPSTVKSYVLYELVLGTKVVDQGNLNSNSRYVYLAGSTYLSSAQKGTEQELFVRVKGTTAKVASWTIQYGLDGRTRCAPLPAFTCVQTSSSQITLTWNGASGNWRAMSAKGSIASGAGVSKLSISSYDVYVRGIGRNSTVYTEMQLDSWSQFAGTFSTDTYWRPVC